MTAESLKALVRAQQRLDKAQADLDAALVRAALETPSRELQETLGLKPATYYRRLASARERWAGEEPKPTGFRILTGANPDPRYQGPDL